MFTLIMSNMCAGSLIQYLHFDLDFDPSIDAVLNSEAILCNQIVVTKE